MSDIREVESNRVALFFGEQLGHDQQGRDQMTMRLVVALSLVSTIVWTIAGADAVPTGFFGNHNLARGKVIPSAAVTVNGAQASALLAGC